MGSNMAYDPNHSEWQNVPEYFADEPALANNFRFRRLPIVGGGRSCEMFVSDQALDEIYDWLTARDEAINNPRM